MYSSFHQPLSVLSPDSTSNPNPIPLFTHPTCAASTGISFASDLFHLKTLLRWSGPEKNQLSFGV